MKISTGSLRGLQVVNVSGVVDRYSAGYLSDALIESVRNGGGVLLVDLSEVHLMTHAGARGLVVAAKLLESACGTMRICGARVPVEAILRSLGFNHLLKFEPSVSESLTALGLDRTAAAARNRMPTVRSGYVRLKRRNSAHPVPMMPRSTPPLTSDRRSAS